MKNIIVLICLVACCLFAVTQTRGADPAAEAAAAAVKKYPFVFRDVAQEIGLYPAIKGVRGHAGMLGDYTGDGWIDFYVGAFQTPDSSPSVVFRSEGGKRFVKDDQPLLTASGRTTGGAFADFDNDGDLDLYVSNNTDSSGGSGKKDTGNFLFRNDGGKFTDVTAGSNAAPPYSSRNVVPIDFDGDGLLDIVLGGGRLRVDGVQAGRPGGRLIRNLGGMKFADASEALPEGVASDSVAAYDLNNDTLPDIIYGARKGGVMINTGGKFALAEEANKVILAGFNFTGDKVVTMGVCAADVNRDGLLDLVIGQHDERPWKAPFGPRLFLNRGMKNGQLVLEDVTEKAGLVPLPMKCPNIEIVDFDNDGWPDIYVSVFKFAGGKTYPVIFKHMGLKDGIPQYKDFALAVNDFPTEQDRTQGGSATPFFDRMNKERKITYAVAAPCGDYDKDGRIDIFCAEWWAENPSFLLHNETPGGNWVQVVVKDAPKVNRMGLGSKVRIYEPGKLGDASALIGCQDIAISYGYSSSQEAMAHFGLGKLTACDVEVILPHNQGKLTKQNVTANQRLTLP